MSRLGVLLFLLALLACGDEAPATDADAGLEPACAREDCLCDSEADCLAHSECIMGDGQSQCECVAGYEKTGDFCIFAGIGDPDVNGDPAAWQVEGTLVIESTPQDLGMKDEGMATWGDAALDVFDGLTQIVTMPALDEAEPFVTVVNSRVRGNAYYYLWYAPRAMLQLGAQRTRLPIDALNQWKEHRVCLGEGAYGTDLLIGIEPSNIRFPPPFGGLYDALEVDFVQIQPAIQGECPAVGEVMGGDFENLDGWRAYSVEPAFAGVEGVGFQNSRAGVLRTTNCGQPARLSTQMSVPKKDIGQALQFKWQSATERTQVLVGMGLAEFYERLKFIGARTTMSVGSLNGTHDLSTEKLCIPPQLLGTVTTLELSMRTGGSGCSEQEREFVIDDVEIVDEPNCPTEGYGADPGFELQGSAIKPGWSQVRDLGDSGAVERRASVELSPDAVEGARVLRLTSTTNNVNATDGGCRFGAMGVQSRFVYSDAAPGQRPAIRFSYRFSGVTDTLSEGSYVRMMQSQNRFAPDLPETQIFPAVDSVGQPLVGWQTALVCAPYAERLRPLEISLHLNVTECDLNPSDIVAEFDNVELLAVPEGDCPVVPAL